jgi:glutaredoxin-related protein
VANRKIFLTLKEEADQFESVKCLKYILKENCLFELLIDRSIKLGAGVRDRMMVE